MAPDWMQILSLGINGATLVTLIKVIRNFSRLELKVELMWKNFTHKFGFKDQDGDES